MWAHVHRWLVSTPHQDARNVSRNYSKPSLKSQRTWLTAAQTDRGASKQPTATAGPLQMMGWLQHCQELISVPVVRFTFAVAFIPGKDAVLNAITHQRCVDAHVAVAKERTSRTGGWKTSTDSSPEADVVTKTMQQFFPKMRTDFWVTVCKPVLLFTHCAVCVLKSHRMRSGGACSVGREPRGVAVTQGEWGITHGLRKKWRASGNGWGDSSRQPTSSPLPHWCPAWCHWQPCYKTWPAKTPHVIFLHKTCCLSDTKVCRTAAMYLGLFIPVWQCSFNQLIYLFVVFFFILQPHYL